jgi:integrase
MFNSRSSIGQNSRISPQNRTGGLISRPPAQRKARIVAAKRKTPKINFKDSYIKALKPPLAVIVDGKKTYPREDYRDTEVKGLLLRVSANGAKTWALRYSLNGKQSRLTIGTYPDITLAQARAQALAARIEIGNKNDPAAIKAAQKKAGKAADTADKRARAAMIAAASMHEGFEPSSFGAIALDHIDLVQSQNRYRKSFEATVRRHLLPSLGLMPIGDIAPRDIDAVLDELVLADFPAAANNVYAISRVIFNWAVSRDYLAKSPLAGRKPPAKMVSRDHYLTEAEIIAFWEAAADIGGPFGNFYKVALLTGQRRNEVAGMEWAELDFDKGIWTIPAWRMKKDRKHIVPLAPFTIRILKAMDKKKVNKKYVFAIKADAKPIQGWSVSKRQIDGLMELNLKRDYGPDMELQPWRIHDCRRSCATYLAQMGTPLHITAAILNHAPAGQQGVTATYNRHSYTNERRRAMLTWATYLELLTAGDESAAYFYQQLMELGALPMAQDYLDVILADGAERDTFEVLLETYIRRFIDTGRDEPEAIQAHLRLIAIGDAIDLTAFRQLIGSQDKAALDGYLGLLKRTEHDVARAHLRGVATKAANVVHIHG